MQQLKYCPSMYPSFFYIINVFLFSFILLLIISTFPSFIKRGFLTASFPHPLPFLFVSFSLFFLLASLQVTHPYHCSMRGPFSLMYLINYLITSKNPVSIYENIPLPPKAQTDKKQYPNIHFRH